jgi:hypothetical protein
MMKLARGIAAKAGAEKFFPKGALNKRLPGIKMSFMGQRPEPIAAGPAALMALAQLYQQMAGIQHMRKMATAWSEYFGGSQELARHAREMGGTAPVVFEIDDNTGRMRAMRDVRDAYGETPFKRQDHRFRREATRANQITFNDINALKRWQAGKSQPALSR